MPKLAIVATIEAAAGRMDELLPLLMAHRARCLRDEPGTLQFDFLVPSDDKTKVLLIEVYKDEDALKAHWTGASMATFREQSAGMVEKMTGTRGSIAE
jgi:(4S)-4-hydroxy-5-phosphonooxypentane-2,3-dione isomerase